MTKEAVMEFFERYECFFMDSLNGKVNADEIASLYASEFIAASEKGVMAGKNDAGFMHAMEQGCEYYRSIGTKSMHVRNVDISPIDAMHCVAHVAWTAKYSTEKNPNIEIDFDVHYLMQELDGKLQVFGWVSGDEQEALKQHGVIK